MSTLPNPLEQAVEIIREERAEQHQLINSIMLRKGQTLYRFNMRTGELAIVGTDDTAYVQLDGGIKLKREALHHTNCFYVMAINDKNALRKALNRVEELTGKRPEVDTEFEPEKP